MTQHETLAAALAAMQAELPKLRKTETAKVTGESKNGGRVNYSYGYAGLDEVVETVLPALGKHGLSVTSKTVVSPEGFTLEVALLHEGGERETGFWPLPSPRNVGPQDIGSAMTYGRRYLTLALTGTFPGGEDDDGAKAQARSERALPENFSDLPKQRPAGQQNRPVSAPPAPAKDWSRASDEDLLDLHAKLDSPDLGKVGKLYDWMASKGIHTRKVGTLTEEGISPMDATTRLALRLAATAQDETTTVENITQLHDFADGRGLLKTQVAPKSTLGDWLTEQKDRRTQEAVAASELAQAARASAAASWDDQPTEGEHQAEQHAQSTP